MTVMADVVMPTTAVALRSIDGCEDLPKEFALEDLKMWAVSGFEDAMESNLGVVFRGARWRIEIVPSTI